MNSRLSRDDAFEVSDSTDWLGTPLSSLAIVDSALRCQVCKDFYSTPMITSCCHTFCSICIRRCLSNDAKCPACRTQDQENRLRFNGAMEELVQAFLKARPEVLKHARTPKVILGRASPKRSRDEANLAGDQSPRKRTRSSTRATQSNQTVAAMDLNLDDHDYVLEEGFALCPICRKALKIEAIDPHIERGCVDEPSAKISNPPQKSHTLYPKFGKRPERLATLNYGSMKESALRKRLQDAGISAQGKMDLMKKRYTEWVTLWNANCDATSPKSKSELKRELEIWERTQGLRVLSTSQNPIRDKDFDGAAYSKLNDELFRGLITNARKPPSIKFTDESSFEGAESRSHMVSAVTQSSKTEMLSDAFTDSIKQPEAKSSYEDNLDHGSTTGETNISKGGSKINQRGPQSPHSNMSWSVDRETEIPSDITEIT